MINHSVKKDEELHFSSFTIFQHNLLAITVFMYLFLNIIYCFYTETTLLI